MPDTRSMKRVASETPSPPRSPKRRLAEQLPDVAPAPQDEKHVQLSADAIFARMKPLKGRPPHFIDVSIADHERGRIYCVLANKITNASALWSLCTSTMQWEKVPMHPLAEDVFLPDKPPFRSFPGLALFGPKDHRRILLFGGIDVKGNHTSDLMWLDIKLNRWSRVPIDGGSIIPRRSPSMILVGHYQLFIFGGNSQRGWLKHFSLAVFDPSTSSWTWQIQDRELPPILMGCSKVMAAPLHDGQKLLVLGTSCNGKYFDVPNNLVFTFDPETFTIAQDPHVRPGASPLSFSGSALRPGIAVHEALVSTVHDEEESELWSYRAFPESKWRLLLKLVLCPSLKIRHTYSIACMGKVYVVFRDERDGKNGVNSYIELDGPDSACV